MAIRTNLCPNPSFETAGDGLSKWTAAGSGDAGATTTTTRSYSGLNSAVVTANGASPKVLLESRPDTNSLIPVTVGHVYTISAYGMAPVGMKLSMYAFPFSAVPQYMGTYGDTAPITSTDATAWYRQVFTFRATQPYLMIGLQATMGDASSNVPNGTQVYWDAVMVEEGTTAGTYFDGPTTFAPPTRTNLVPNPSMRAVTGNTVDGYQANEGCLAVSTDRGVSSDGKSLLLLPTTPTNTDSSAYIGGDGGAIQLGMQPGRTYTCSATITVPNQVVGDLFPDGSHPRARRIVAFVKTAGGVYVEYPSDPGPVTGTARVAVSFSLPSDVTEAFIRLYNGATNAAENAVIWDDVLLEESSTAGEFFIGTISVTEELTHALNRLAHTDNLDAQGAANKWAGTTGLDLLGALNKKARTTGLGLPSVLNRLAAQSNNLLTTNQATVETDLAGFGVGYACTIARNTSTSASGTASLAVTAAGPGGFKAEVGGAPVVPGRTYTGVVSIKGSAARNALAQMTFFNAGGATVGEFAINGPASPLSTTTFVQYTVWAVAPAGAAFASLGPVVNDGSSVVGDVMYADQFGISEGWSTVWQSPELPATYLGVNAAAAALVSDDVLRDSFNRPDSPVMLGLAESGQTYQVTDGAFGISGGQACIPNGGNSRVITPAAADVFAEVTVAATDIEAWLVFRASTATPDYWRFGFRTANSVELQKVVAGSVTVLAGPFDASVGSRLAVKCLGSTVTAFINGQSLATVADSFNSTASAVGLQCFTTPARFDNLWARALTS